MGFDIAFGRGEPLPPGIYDAVVDSADDQRRGGICPSQLNK